MITSPSNRLIKEIQALNSLRKRREQTGLFVAEGRKLFDEAPAELRYRTVISEEYEKTGEPLPDDIPYDVVPDSLFRRISDTKTPQGILSVLRKPVYKREQLLDYENPFLLLLEDIQDPGNLGSMIRTAEGAGVTGVVMSKGCADLFQPKTIRSTMGSVFRVPFLVVDDMPAFAKELKRGGFVVAGTHLSGDVSYTEAPYEMPCAVIIGNEGKGMSERLARECSLLLKIPMEGRVESLNAAAAAAVVLYAAHAARHRGAQKGKGDTS